MSWKDIKTWIHFSQCLHLDMQQIARPLFIHALPEWQKTTAQSAIPGASIIQGVVSKGYEVSKSLAHVLYLQLNSLVNLSYAVTAKIRLWSNIETTAGQKMKEML